MLAPAFAADEDGAVSAAIPESRVLVCHIDFSTFHFIWCMTYPNCLQLDVLMEPCSLDVLFFPLFRPTPRNRTGMNLTEHSTVLKQTPAQNMKPKR